jgi:hypothetical protein
VTRRVFCSCRSYCGDVDERDDDPNAVCRALRPPPVLPVVRVVLVPRDGSDVRHRTPH